MTRRDRIVREGGITKLGCMKNTEKFTSPPSKRGVKRGNLGNDRL